MRLIAAIALVLALAGCTSKSYSFVPDKTDTESDNTDPNVTLECGVLTWKVDHFWSSSTHSLGRYCPVSRDDQG